MTFSLCLITLITSLCVHKTLECVQKNISCNSIRMTSPQGFGFSHQCSGANYITVTKNVTVIAVYSSNQSTKHSSEVIRMDNHSVVTRECEALKVKCTIPDGSTPKDLCVDFKIIEKTKDPSDLPTSHGIIIGISCGVLLFVGIPGIIIGIRYMCWKKQHRAATVSGFLRHMWPCCFLRQGVSEAETGERTELSLDEMSPATDPHPGAENEQDDILETVHVPSIDPKADSKTPQTNSLGCNLASEGIQPTENGDTSALDVCTAFDYLDIKRYLTDDPGGITYNKAGDTVKGVVSRDMYSGRTWTYRDRGSEHPETKSPLLMNQPAPIQDSDVTDEAVALVNKDGFDHASRCFIIPDTDVESTPNMKNGGLHKYK
uniref:uncharacterized protein LOC109965848 isoform X2 n=1 Tax=Monopterus albus TaxID=43700 RepID=UPI0009B303B3|nr:uncharacterized protein LOC109965848 isoform X2 [Monopterus albus]